VLTWRTRQLRKTALEAPSESRKKKERRKKSGQRPSACLLNNPILEAERAVVQLYSRRLWCGAKQVHVQVLNRQLLTHTLQRNPSFATSE
jgi:hypothetical protein